MSDAPKPDPLPGFDLTDEGATLTMTGLRPVPVEPAMQAAIDAALNRLEDDEKGAVVAYGDLERLNLAVMAKLGSGWSFVGIVDRDWQGNLGAAAQVRKAWK